MPPKKAFKPGKSKRGAAGHNGSLRAAALRRLKAVWELEHEGEEWEPENEPSIEHMLRTADGGIPTVIEAIRASSSEEARDFIEVYDGLSVADRKALPIEHIAFASGVGSARLAGLAAEAIVSAGHIQTQLLMGSAMHRVMKATVKAATDEMPILDGQGTQVGRTNGDVKAMEMFHKMTGMMPTPKGSQIAIQNVYSRPDSRNDEPPTLQGWRSPDERLREIVAVTEQKQLESPRNETSVIKGKGVVEFEHAR